MSVLIKGMEMPEEGEYHMTLYVCSDGSAYIDVASFPVDGDRFEAVPVPSHGRLGDLDRLAKEVEDMIKEFPLDSIGAERYRLFAELIKTAPTVIPASEEAE